MAQPPPRDFNDLRASWRSRPPKDRAVILIVGGAIVAIVCFVLWRQVSHSNSVCAAEIDLCGSAVANCTPNCTQNAFGALAAFVGFVAGVAAFLFGGTQLYMISRGMLPPSTSSDQLGPTEPPPPSKSAGWYQDPWGIGKRWWDGERWTTNVSQ